MLTKRLGTLLASLFLLFECLGYVSSATRFALASRGSPVSRGGQPPFGGYQAFESTLLKMGEPIKREITRGETQSLSIEPGEGKYAQVVFEWQGIDLNVAVYDPMGARLLPSDVLVFPPGPVSVAIQAAKPGIYKLEVTTPVRQRISGTYQVKLEAVRFPTSADLSRVAAQKMVAEGRSINSGPEAIVKYRKALLQWQSAQDVDAEAQTLLLLGEAYRSVPDPPNAKASYESAAQLWSGTGYLRGAAYAKMSLGATIRSSRLAKDALPYYGEARALFSQIGDRRGESSALYGQAFTHMLIGQTPQALESLHPALEIRRAAGDRLGEASALNMMADAYRMLGDLEKSLNLYGQTAEALKGLEHRSLEAAVINGKILVYDDMGDWQQAKDGYNHALSLYESLLGQQGLSVCSSKPSTPDFTTCRSAATVIDNLGETYNSMGDSEKALREFSRSIIIRNALGEARGKGSTNFHLGYAHFLLGDTAKALDYYGEALRFQKEAGDEKGTALTLTYKAMAFVARNEPRLALDLYQQAMPLQQASGDKRALAITFDKLGNVYGLLGRSDEGSDSYGKALEIWRSIKDPDGEALTLYNIANAEREAGNLSAASKHTEETIKLVESLRTKLTAERLRVSYLANKRNYYELDIDLKMELGKSGNLNNYLAAALESNEKARARALLDALSEAGLGRAEFNQPSNSELARLIEQRVSLLGRLRVKVQARTKLLSGGQPGATITFVDNEIERLTEQMDEIDAQVKSENPRFATLTKPQPSTLAQIQGQLDAGTLLLEYSLGEKRSYVWAVSPNSINGLELPARDQIEPVARRMTAALTARNRGEKNESFPQRQLRIDRSEKEYSEASVALSKLILAPVASLLGGKRLIVVADGALQLVPFAALPAPGSLIATQSGGPTRSSNDAGSAYGPSRLIDEHEIISLPSASVLALQRRELANRQPAPFAVAVIADPVFDDHDVRVAKATGIGNQHRKETANTGLGGELVTPKSEKGSSSHVANGNSALSSALRDVGMSGGNLPRLALSRQEARAIARAVSPSQSFSALDFKASRQTATSQELSKYRIIHFATHGVLDLEHPELSGIVLSMVDEKGQPQDGYLRLHEIYNLNLPAELVVLSACQTGIGKQVRGEGLIALTRGFMYAGAKSVVASLWKVDDAATSELMAEFYKQMFTNKLKPATALRAAQVKMSQQKRWQSPYYWAGFFLQGEWN